jgi:hypothetical protein
MSTRRRRDDYDPAEASGAVRAAQAEVCPECRHDATVAHQVGCSQGAFPHPFPLRSITLTRRALEAINASLAAHLAGEATDGGDMDGTDMTDLRRAKDWAEQQLNKRAQRATLRRSRLG